MNENGKIKRYEELNFTDDFMFCKILQNDPDLCRELTELILSRKIGRIVSIDRQKAIEITADGKGVRFDVYMEDDESTVYDIEMQTTVAEDLPKRMRYYQGMIDLNMIERGARYKELKKSFIIFICLKNPYPEAGLHKYSIRSVCEEDMAIDFDDGIFKIDTAAGSVEQIFSFDWCNINRSMIDSLEVLSADDNSIILCGTWMVVEPNYRVHYDSALMKLTKCLLILTIGIYKDELRSFGSIIRLFIDFLDYRSNRI